MRKIDMIFEILELIILVGKINIKHIFPQINILLHTVMRAMKEKHGELREYHSSNSNSTFQN